MVKFVPYQDIFSLPADYYVNTNNTQGIAGAGLARYFADKRPKETAVYIKECKEKKYQGGDILIVGDVIFAFTKQEVWKDSSLEYIKKILKNLYEEFKSAVTPTQIVSTGGLGCGFGRPFLYCG